MNRRQWMSRTAPAVIGLGLAAPAAAGVLPARGRELAVLPRNPAPLPTSRTRPPAPDGLIRLHSNENPLGPSDSARQAMIDAMDDSCWYPTDYYPELIAQIAEGEGVEEDQVFIGAGSHEVLRTAGTAIGIDKGHVVLPSPTYEAYGTYAEAVGAVLHRIPLTARFETDLEAMAAAVTPETKAVYICNPNNPTGLVVPSADIRQFTHDLNGSATVIVDEANHGYPDVPEYETSVDLVRQGADVIVSRTFSKLHGLAGIRIGYALTQADTVRELMRYRNKHSVNRLAVAAAMASYADQDFIRAAQDENTVGRQIVYAAAQAAGMDYIQSQGGFVFIHVGEPVESFQRRMVQRGIKVGRAFPPYLDWARISIGTKQNMDTFAEALASIADEVGSG